MYNKETNNKIEKGLDYLNNNPKKAQIIFYEILEIEPENVKALNGMGSSLIKQNKFDEAESYFDKSLSIKETASAYLNKGLINKNKEKYAEAIINYDKAISMNSQLNSIIQILKKEIGELIEHKEIDNYIKEFDENTRILIKQAIYYRKSNHLWDALDSYELAIKNNYECHDILIEPINEIKIQLQKEFLFKQPLFEKTEKNQLIIKVFQDLMQGINQTESLITINKALDIDPENLDALNLKGCILFYLDDFEGALFCYDKCLHIREDYVYAIFNKALIYRRMRKLNLSITCYNQIKNTNLSPNLKMYQEEILERLEEVLEIPFHPNN